MIRKYFVYVMFVLLLAWYYHASIEESIEKKVKNVRKASPFIDGRVEGEIERAMGR